MGRLFSLTVLVLFVGVSAASAQRWVTPGIITNPLVDTVLCDSGPISTPNPVDMTVRATVTANVGAFVDLQHRNTANTAAVITDDAPTGENQPIAVQANGTADVRDWVFKAVADQERIQVRTIGALVGKIQCTLRIQ